MAQQVHTLGCECGVSVMKGSLGWGDPVSWGKWRVSLPGRSMVFIM